MEKELSPIEFLANWVKYEIAKEEREKAENENSAEQQAYIGPLFAIAFPGLAAEGITYNDSWKCDNCQDAINAWEETAGIDEYCSKIAEKNRDKIDELLRLETEAQKTALNSALDMLEQDSKRDLTPEQMQHFREKVNAKGWNYERQKFIEYIQEFIDKTRGKQ